MQEVISCASSRVPCSTQQKYLLVQDSLWFLVCFIIQTLQSAADSSFLLKQIAQILHFVVNHINSVRIYSQRLCFLSYLSGSCITRPIRSFVKSEVQEAIEGQNPFKMRNFDRATRFHNAQVRKHTHTNSHTRTHNTQTATSSKYQTP